MLACAPVLRCSCALRKCLVIAMGFAVNLSNVSKRFFVSHEKPAMVRGLIPGIRRAILREPFLALRDVSFKLKSGTCLGVFGPNGSGKSTLLSVIAKITPPSQGCIASNGKIAALLSLGCGFHPELNGLENIFLNGALLGLSTRQIRERRESIIAFCELEDFIDAPLQTYSSGMKLRLGFAIALHSDFDILIMDELMQVGDIAFQERCIERLKACKKEGKTIIIAAQSVDALKPLADQALLLHRGQCLALGSLSHVQQRYDALKLYLSAPWETLSSEGTEIIQQQADRQMDPTIAYWWGMQWGTGEAELGPVILRDAAGESRDAFVSAERMCIDFQFEIKKRIRNPHIGIAIFRDDFTYCYGPNTRADGIQIEEFQPSMLRVRLWIDHLDLNPGSYSLAVSMWDPEELAPPVSRSGVCHFEVVGPESRGVVLAHHAE